MRRFISLLCATWVVSVGLELRAQEECPQISVPTGPPSFVDGEPDTEEYPEWRWLDIVPDGTLHPSCGCWYLVHVKFSFKLEIDDSIRVHSRTLVNGLNDVLEDSDEFYIWIRSTDKFGFGLNQGVSWISWARIDSATVIETRVGDAFCGGNTDSYHGCGEADVITMRVPGIVLPVARREEVRLLQSSQTEPFAALTMSEREPGPNLLSPVCLGYAPTSETELLLDPTTEAIRQVKGLELLDVVVISAHEYDIRIYGRGNIGPKDTNGFYTTTGNPRKTYKLKNPDPVQYPGNERIQIIEQPDGGSDIVNDYTWSAVDQGWTLDRANGLCLEKNTVTTNASGEEVHTFEIQDPTSGTPLYTRQIIYGTAPNGDVVMVARNINPYGPDPQLYSYSYISGASNPDQSFVESVTHPDGRVVSYAYDGNDRMLAERGHFLNQSWFYQEATPAIPVAWEKGFRTSHDYVPLSGSGDDGSIEPDEPRSIAQLIDGDVVRHTYKIYKPGERQTIVVTDPVHPWDDPGNLATIEKYFTSGPNLDRLQSVENPDSTMTIYDYVMVGSDEEETITQGEPNAAKDAIVNGTKTVNVYDDEGKLKKQTMYAIQQGVGVDYKTDEIIHEYDGDGRRTKTTYFDGTFEEFGYTCCQLEWERSRQGVVTTYEYDDMHRKVRETRHGITLEYVYDAASNLLETNRKGTDGSIVTLRTATYDDGGKRLTETNALGGTTTFSEWIDTNGQRTVKTVNPDGGERFERFFKDGRLDEVWGDASFPERFEYSPEDNPDQGGFFKMLQTKNIKRLHAPNSQGWTDLLEATLSYEDFAGRSYRFETGINAGSPLVQVSLYNDQGQLIRSQDQNGNSQFYGYNSQGEQEWIGVDMDGNGQIDEVGSDQIVKTITDVTTYDFEGVTYEVERTQTLGYPDVASATTRVLSESLTSTDRTHSWSITYRDFPSTPIVSHSHTQWFANGDRVETQTSPGGAQSISIYSGDRLQTTLSQDANGNPLTRMDYSYDVHGRVGSVMDIRNGTTQYVYNAADQVTSATTPSPDGVAPAQTTQTEYDNQGRVIKVTYPDLSTDHTEYYKTGQVSKRYGSRTTPIEYGYDTQGRMIWMVTWSDFDFVTGQGISGSRQTSYDYNDHFGTLSEKLYPIEPTDPPGEDHKETYGYTVGGLIVSRGGLGATTIYNYDAAGNLLSEGSKTYTYDRIGRRETASENGHTAAYDYNDGGQLTREEWTQGHQTGFAVEHDYDTSGFRIQTRVLYQGALKQQIDYSYEPETGRLSTVSSNGHDVTYEYLAHSGLLRELSFDDGSGNPPMRTRRTYDKLNRLVSILTEPGMSRSQMGFHYQYDSANRRSKATAADGSWWDYAYDGLGQLTSGKRYWADGSLVGGQDFEYAYDDLGNRTSTGGRLSSQSTYSDNSRNQLTARTAPGHVDVMGLANPDDTIWVNNQATFRKQEYFHRALPLTTSATQISSLQVAVPYVGAPGASDAVTLYGPMDPDVHSYNEKGELIQDSYWNYTWDNHGRLIQIDRRDYREGVPERVEYGYDPVGRRIYRKVTPDLAQTQTYPPVETVFVYDGWNLLGEYTTSGVPKRTYVWGADLSGTPQGAGGVGGLLMVTDNEQTGAPSYFTSYDGNGNVIALVTPSDRSSAAVYEYGPFGEPIRKTGNVAETNPFQFSTKYTDDETGLVYYGMRYYDPITGRWNSRDSLGEKAGVNVYVFSDNDPVNRFDYLGLSVIKWKAKRIRPLSAAFDLAFDDEACELSVELNLQFVFPGLLSERQRRRMQTLYSRWERRLESRRWYGGWMVSSVTSCMCPDVNVEFDFGFSEASSDGTHGVVLYDFERLRSNQTTWRLGDERFTFSPYSGVAHEVGHWLSLENEYPPLEGDPDQDRVVPDDWEESVMGGMGSSSKLLKRHMERILLDAGEINVHLPSSDYEVVE